MVPSECLTGATTPEVFFDLYKQGDSTRVAYQWYDDQFSRFILVGSSSYSAGDVYNFGVEMKEWRDYPSAHRDVTVGIYSKQTLTIKDANGNSNVEHYDGQLPTGFTESTYRGMNPDEEETAEISNLVDLFSAALEGGFFTAGLTILSLCFGEAMSICFKPLYWF